MRRSLTFKLVAAFLGVSLFAIALVALSSAAVAALEFNRLVSQEATNNFLSFVTDYYNTHGSLTGIDDALRQGAEGAQTTTGEPPRLFPSPLTEPSGLVVIGGEGYRVGQNVPPAVLVSGTPIKVNGVAIAVSLPRQLPPPRSRAQEQFVQNAGLALGVGAAGAALLAVLLGVFLARTITRPVDELTRAARRMAKGDLAQTVNVHSRDEVGELAAAFNQMSADLARADLARRQMTADIAHELRNPLTVMGGYLDAMRAGDLPPTPARLEAVYAEIEHLENLVEDLRTLSLADAGALSLERQPLAPRELLNRVAARYAQQAGQKNITLTVQAAAELPEIQVDEARMMQVFSNLVSNALRYTPPQGQVRFSAKASGNAVRFEVADTGEGIPPEDLPRVFERFYRADQSRHGGNGELGLGLAIAKAFVQAHGGKIAAESTPGRGTTFVVELPVLGSDGRRAPD
jgi:signal transduction histidine kinase